MILGRVLQIRLKMIMYVLVIFTPRTSPNAIINFSNLKLAGLKDEGKNFYNKGPENKLRNIRARLPNRIIMKIFICKNFGKQRSKILNNSPSHHSHRRFVNKR